MVVIDPRILSKTVKTMTPKKERVEEAQVRGTVVYQSGEHYIKLDGATSDSLTPIANIEEGSSDSGFTHGDRVLVLIKNHQAIVTKNLTTGLQANAAKDASEFTTAITDEGITADRIIANDTFTNTLRANGITADEIIAGQAVIDTLDSNYAHITNGVIDNAEIGYADVNGLDANFAHISNGVIDNAKIGHADVNGLNANYAHVTNGVIDNADIDVADVRNLSTTYATIENLEANYAHMTDGVIDNAKIGHADVNGLNANYAHITNGTIDNAKIGHADVNGLNANYAHITNGAIDNAKIGYADVNDLDAHYAEIDLANVNNAWIDNGVIKNGAISDAQINDVSANKLTTGTIDAGVINVINLNASNLTVGTINGQRIGNGSIDLEKLSEQVPTKEYLDSVEKNLQDQIDGVINTWTGTDIPTLSNYPATNWPDAKTRDAHIGDIYYVLNEESEYDGWCYRFVGVSYDASIFVTPDDKMLAFPDGDILAIYAGELAYKWVLIKDSDVTKALAELITVQGDVSGLKSFRTSTTSWMTNTDEEISSVKGRTISLETNIGSKVDVTTFNTLSQTVDSNTADITSLTNTVVTKADSSTVTILSNNVNEVSQTANGNSSKISNLTTTLGTNSDGTTAANDIVHKASAIEQDLNGFKTTVSSTYQTKDAMSGYSTTSQMNTAIQQSANSITQSVSETYQTKADMDDYSTTSEMNSAINQKAGEITQSVSTTYETKTDATAKLNTAKGYTNDEIVTAKAAIKLTTDAISTEVSTKVGQDEVISRINQSAEEIKIEASRVNIVGVINAINNDTTTTIDGGKIKTGSITVGSLESSIQDIIEATDSQLTLDVEYTWGSTSVTLSAKVYRNGMDIHDTFPSYMFTWNKEMQSGVTRLGTGYSITVQRTELTYAGTIILDLLVGEPLILNLPTDGMLLMPDNKLLTLTIGKEYL